MRSSGNPVFRKLNKMEYGAENYNVATYTGVGLKILYFIIIAIISAFVGIYFAIKSPEVFVFFLIGSLVLGFISALVAMIKPKLALPFGTVYSICEGVLLGVISAIAEEIVPGVVMTTIFVTLSIVLVCAVLFLTGLIKVSNGFYRFLMIFAIGFMLAMLMMFVVTLFGILTEISWPIYILVGVLSCLLATLFLISDMNQAYQLVSNGGPKEYEWMVAFGISYTVLWIYLEILRIMVIIFGNRK